MEVRSSQIPIRKVGPVGWVCQCPRWREVIRTKEGAGLESSLTEATKLEFNGVKLDKGGVKVGLKQTACIPAPDTLPPHPVC